MDGNVNAFFQELLHSGLYKRNQGRVTRQVTFSAIAITVALGFWRLHTTLSFAQGELIKGWNEYWFALWLPGLLLAGSLWIAYRAVNVPNFADFLIAVEAEMNKVSWPSKPELFRASLVVLVTIFLLALLLTGFDLFWRLLFQLLGLFPEKPPVS
jgi:preprotein translocase subunit SecE